MDLPIKEEKGFKYIEEGEGEVLILLHGLMGALSNWEDVISEFKPNYKVIIPMLPIYDMPILATGVRSLSKFLSRFVKIKKLERFILVGNYLVGHVGLMYVLSHQKNVKALILKGSSGLYENYLGGYFTERESFDLIKKKENRKRHS